MNVRVCAWVRANEQKVIASVGWSTNKIQMLQTETRLAKLFYHNFHLLSFFCWFVSNFVRTYHQPKFSFVCSCRPTTTIKSFLTENANATILKMSSFIGFSHKIIVKIMDIVKQFICAGFVLSYSFFALLCFK